MRKRMALGLLLVVGCGGPPPIEPAGPVPSSHESGSAATKSQPNKPPPKPAVAPAEPADAPPPSPYANGTFPPLPFQPPHERTAKPSDGTWSALPHVGVEPASMLTTEIHPDPIKKWVAVAVVAVDLARVELHMVAGTDEPASKNVPKEKRPGLIPKNHLDSLIAATNGGFKATHGKYGMMLNGDEFVPPRDDTCAIAFMKNGQVLVDDWSELADRADQMLAWRQTPACLIDDGELHEKLQTDLVTKKWGASDQGKVDVRRSAMGLSDDGRTLLFAIGDWTSAQDLARALKLAGAHHAAQLDINYSFTRFTLYEHMPDGTLKASSPLLKELKFTQKGYIESAAHRDFFYFTHRDAPLMK